MASLPREQWIGSPCVLVLDCSNAGRVTAAFEALQAARSPLHPKLASLT